MRFLVLHIIANKQDDIIYCHHKRVLEEEVFDVLFAVAVEVAAINVVNT